MLTTTRSHYNVSEQNCVSLSWKICNDRAYQKCSCSHFKFKLIFISVLRRISLREGSEFQRLKIKPFYCIKFHLEAKTLIQTLRIVVLRVIKQSTVILCYCVSRTDIRPVIQTAPGTCKKIWYMIRYDMIYDMIYDDIWYDIWYNDMIYDMIYDMMIWYMISRGFVWVWNLVADIEGENAGWGCLRIGCWGKYLDLRGTRW